MVKYLAHLIAIVSLVVALTTANRIIPKTLKVTSGDRFLLRLEPIDGVEFEKCKLKRNGKKFAFEPGQNKSYDGPDGETLLSFESDDSHECGVRVLSTSSKSAGDWSLKAVNKAMNIISSGTAKISVENPNKTTNSYDKTLTQDILKHPDGRVILKCEAKGRIQSCKIQHYATDRTFDLYSGWQDDQYSAYKTNFDAGSCQFEIMQPQQLSKGRWEMMVNGEGQKCIFNVFDDSDIIKLIEREKKVIEIKTMEQSVEIPCAEHIPYPLEECYLFTVDVPEFYSDYNEMRKGNCNFRVKPGNWTCGFNAPSKSQKYFWQKFEVKHYNTELIDEYANILEDKSLTLGASHVYGKPLKTCIFRSPKFIYTLPSESYESENLSFYGGAMADGHCGIRLTPKNFAAGTWKIIVRKEDDSQLTKEIFVKDQLD